jgi:hypothetical protein
MGRRHALGVKLFREPHALGHARREEDGRLLLWIEPLPVIEHPAEDALGHDGFAVLVFRKVFVDVLLADESQVRFVGGIVESRYDRSTDPQVAHRAAGDQFLRHCAEVKRRGGEEDHNRSHLDVLVDDRLSRAVCEQVSFINDDEVGLVQFPVMALVASPYAANVLGLDARYLAWRSQVWGEASGTNPVVDVGGIEALHELIDQQSPVGVRRGTLPHRQEPLHEFANYPRFAATGG